MEREVEGRGAGAEAAEGSSGEQGVAIVTSRANQQQQYS